VLRADPCFQNAISTSGDEAGTANHRQKGAGDDREAFSCLIELN